MMVREGIFKFYFDEQKEKYDYILMDCLFFFGIVIINVLVVVDKFYILFIVEVLFLKGLIMLDDIVWEVKCRVNLILELGGVFFICFNNWKLNREVIFMVEKWYGEKGFQMKICENIVIVEMLFFGQIIFEYDLKSNGVVDYQVLIDEIISWEENR